MPRRVLVVFHEEVLGGATQSVLRAVPLLEERGWAFAFWASKPSPLFEELGARGLDVEGAPRPIAYSLAALRQPPGVGRRVAGMRGYMRAFQARLSDVSPALVHANSLFTLAEALAAQGAGCPALLHVHEMIPGGWKGALARRLAHQRLAGVIAVSEASSRRLSWRGRQAATVYEAAPLPPTPVPIREQPRPFRVGTVGVISRRKGSDVFVRAAELVRERRDDIAFEIVGAATDALERTWAQRVIAAARVAGVARIPAADVAAKLPGWDVFALPSRRDPFPIAMLEAMAAGLPVIGTRTDGIAEQLDDGSGVLVAPEDPAALAQAIISVADSGAERRAAMGSAARRRVRERFSLERQAAALDEIYRGLARG